MNMSRQQVVVQQFINAIDDFLKGAYSSRGLCARIEQLTTSEEINTFDNSLLSHTYWVTRHLLHQPACWAPTPAELAYLYRCLRNEEEFDQEIADNYRG